MQSESRLLRALRLEAVDATPVWFMRQAGRSLPEYRRIRENYNLLEICRNPDLCAEVTLQPVRRLGVDAAILFADIMLPLLGIGVELDIVEKIGPVIARPIREASHVAGIRGLTAAEDVDFVLDDIEATLAAMEDPVPLIGFSGAPFTLASYLVEGKPSRDFLWTKRMMYTSPHVWHELMQRLVQIVSSYLAAQANAGVNALQLFDTWIGVLSVEDYRRYVQPYTRLIFEELAGLDIPLIHFGTGNPALLELMADAGGSTMGTDWRVPLDVAWERIGYDHGIQGNLDPFVLQGPWQVVQREAQSILEKAGGRSGHVFNLGHGIHPETPVENLQRLVQFVHEWTPRDEQ